jgi:hypothetical protein
MKIWIWVVCIVCFWQFPIKAETVDIELIRYREATRLADQQRFIQAAQQWHQLSVHFLLSDDPLSKRKMWQYAGLAEALAAISANRENNVIAYRYWADSTRYLMTGGTNWELMKKKLQHRYENGNRLLSTFMQVGGLSADDILQQDLAMLQIWRDKLALFSFTSPKLGLSARQTAVVAVDPKQNSQANFNNRQANHHSVFQPNKALTGLTSGHFPDQQMVPRKEFSKPDIAEPESIRSTPSISARASSELSSSELSTQEPSTSKMSMLEPAIVNSVGLIENSEIPLTTRESGENISSSAPINVHPPARGNILTNESESVEAIQRRSFAPEPETKSD